MSKNISMTLPDVVVGALQKLAVKFEMTPAEYVKQYVTAAAMGEVGALRLVEKAAEWLAEDAEKKAAAERAAAALLNPAAGEESGELFSSDINGGLSRDERPESEVFKAGEFVPVEAPGKLGA